MMAIIRKICQHVSEFYAAFRFLIKIVANKSAFNSIDIAPDVRSVQKQFLYVLAAVVLIVQIIAFYTVMNYANDTINAVRDAICTRLASFSHSPNSCVSDGYRHSLNVSSNPQVDSGTLAASIQLLWEALSLSQAVDGYAPWRVLPLLFDYVLLPWMIPLVSSLLVWLLVRRKSLAVEHTNRVRQYATHLFMICIAMPLLLLAPVKALRKLFERAQENFVVSNYRLSGPDYSGTIIDGKSLSPSQAIDAFREFVYQGAYLISITEYAIYALLIATSLRMSFLLQSAIGKTAWKLAFLYSLIFVFLMGGVL